MFVILGLCPSVFAVAVCRLFVSVKPNITGHFIKLYDVLISEKTETRATRRVAKHRFELRCVVSFMKSMILSMILYKTLARTTEFQSWLFISFTKRSLGIVLFDNFVVVAAALVGQF